jgi:hypothetical protein
MCRGDTKKIHKHLSTPRGAHHSAFPHGRTSFGHATRRIPHSGVCWPIAAVCYDRTLCTVVSFACPEEQHNDEKNLVLPPFWSLAGSVACVCGGVFLLAGATG